VLAQEDEEPPESPAELDRRCDELQGLIAQINHTNARAQLATGETVTEGIARRDVIALRQGALRAAIKAATGGSGFGLTRYSRSEIITPGIADRAPPDADLPVRVGKGTE
jgi:hypothetical protein